MSRQRPPSPSGSSDRGCAYRCLQQLVQRRVALRVPSGAHCWAPSCSSPRDGTPQSFMPRDVMTVLVPGTRTKDAQAVTRWQETDLDKWANLEVIVTKVIDHVATSENLPGRRYTEQPIC